MQIFIIANLEVDLVYNKKDDSLSKMDPLSRTLEKRVIKKLLKADFCILQESAFFILIPTLTIEIILLALPIYHNILNILGKISLEYFCCKIYFHKQNGFVLVSKYILFGKM